MKSITFVAVLVLIYAGYVTWKWLQRETFVPNAGVQYLSMEETADFLRRDPDGYVKNMSPTDLIARKASSAEQYALRASRVATNFSADQKVRFNKAAREADAFFTKLSYHGIDSQKLVAIPWIFAMTNGSSYEDGLPHTRADIIFISNDINEQHESLVRTLVHEKLHLYQRMYPEEMAQLLQDQGYKRWKLRMGVPRIRANPDLDPWIYTTSKGEPMVAYYTSDKPANISDVYLEKAAFEHPFERIAYEIAEHA